MLVTTDAIPSGTTDLILDLVKPDGTEVGPVDTISSPETLATELDQEGTYTITVSRASTAPRATSRSTCARCWRRPG